MNAINPLYPTAEDRADLVLHQQRAAEDAFRRACRRFADAIEHIVNQMPLGLHIRGYDAPHILTLVRRDFTNFQEATMEEAMEAVEP